MVDPTWVTIYLPENQDRVVVTRALNEIAKRHRLPKAWPVSKPANPSTAAFLGRRVPKAVRVHPELHALWQRDSGNVAEKAKPQARRKATGKAKKAPGGDD